MSIAEEKLLRRLGHNFQDDALFYLALTHRSASSRNNERLEFLGDSILNFIIGESLFQKFPQAKEGDLSRLRANLVRGTTLAEVATELDIGDCLILGSGEMKSGGHRRESILADAVEALIGAIYSDVGMEAAKQCVLSWYESRLDTITLAEAKDPKTRLQEYLQANKKELPDYQVLSTEGADHDQIFIVACQLSLLKEPVEGKGNSRRAAEQAAAEQALILLGVK